MGTEGIEPRIYIDRCEKLGYHPNFWLSERYFKHAGWRVEQVGDYLRVLDSEGVDMLLPVNLYYPNNKFKLDVLRNMKYVWALYPGITGIMPGNMWVREHMEKLDEQFIFEPSDFLTMEGGDWSTFRKNCRKFPNRYEGGELRAAISHHRDEEMIEETLNILVEWLSALGPDAEVYDDDVILAYCKDPDASFHCIFDGDSNKLLAINIFDTNYAYTNFRYCLCRNLPYLSEYARWKFYTDNVSRWKRVNDGGSLGNPKLHAFKQKMNPSETFVIYTFNQK